MPPPLSDDYILWRVKRLSHQGGSSWPQFWQRVATPQWCRAPPSPPQRGTPPIGSSGCLGPCSALCQTWTLCIYVDAIWTLSSHLSFIALHRRPTFKYRGVKLDQWGNGAIKCLICEKFGTVARLKILKLWKFGRTTNIGLFGCSPFLQCRIYIVLGVWLFRCRGIST